MEQFEIITNSGSWRVKLWAKSFSEAVSIANAWERGELDLFQILVHHIDPVSNLDLHGECLPF